MKKVYSFILITVFSASVFGQTVPSYVPTNGLVGWWPFNGNANDESGNGNNGTVNGATLTTDRFGNANKAYSFDGVTNYISVPTSNSTSNFQNGQSLSFWIKIPAFPTDGKEHYIITKGFNGFYQTWLSDYSNADALFYRCSDGITSSQGTNITFPNLNLNQWIHICFVNNLTNTYTYLNGNLFATYSASPIGITTSPLIFGKANNENSTNAPYNGNLDDIGIWNRALTQAEITALYTANGVGLKDQSLNQLSIYPNPAKTQITLNTTTNQIGKTLKVYDALGKVVYESIIKQEQSNISITHWANGIYTVAIPEQNLTYKFVKE